jgi:hypothetical protein
MPGDFKLLACAALFRRPKSDRPAACGDESTRQSQAGAAARANYTD